MSVNFTDLLIELCDPGVAEDFDRDPERFALEYGLSTDEQMALRTRSSSYYRRLARSFDESDRRNSVNQFNRGLMSLEVIVHPELHVEVFAPNEPENFAVEQGGGMFIDAQGRCLRARRGPNHAEAA